MCAVKCEISSVDAGFSDSNSCCCFWYRCCCCRFFAETSATLFTTVLGQRQGRSDAAEPVTEYMLSDSSLGSFRAQVRTLGCKVASQDDL